jgi:hypothetical protein
MSHPKPWTLQSNPRLGSGKYIVGGGGGAAAPGRPNKATLMVEDAKGILQAAEIDFGDHPVEVWHQSPLTQYCFSSSLMSMNPRSSLMYCFSSSLMSMNPRNMYNVLVLAMHMTCA